MKDFLGNEIKVGDEIVYAAGLGQCSALCHAKVLEVIENHEPLGAKTALKVQRIKTQYGEYGESWRKDRGLLERSVNLKYPNRCVVVKRVVIT